MTVKAVVITSTVEEARKVKFEDYELVKLLGEKEDALAVRIDEVVRAISDSVRSSVTAESELTIEITGSVSLHGRSDIKWIFFNIGASAAKSDTLKVTLKTKINPA